MRILILMATLAVLAACSSQSVPVAVSYQSHGQDEHGQSWKFVPGERVEREALPATSDMKLVNFNVRDYVKMKCLKFFREESCQVFAQTDSNGSLSGYLILYGNGESFSASSDTRTTPSGPASMECMISGAVDVTKGDPNSDFSGRIFFTNKLDATGIFYLERIGNQLKVEDERWNYCYDDRHIDDVYTLVGSITKKIDNSLWPATLPAVGE